jgi:hypothetical protein
MPKYRVGVIENILQEEIYEIEADSPEDAAYRVVEGAGAWMWSGEPASTGRRSPMVTWCDGEELDNALEFDFDSEPENSPEPPGMRRVFEESMRALCRKYDRLEREIEANNYDDDDVVLEQKRVSAQIRLLERLQRDLGISDKEEVVEAPIKRAIEV